MPPFLFDVVDGTVELTDSSMSTMRTISPSEQRTSSAYSSPPDAHSSSSRYFAEDTLMILATLCCQLLLWAMDPTLWTIGALGILMSTIFIMIYMQLDISCIYGTMFVVMFFITILAYVLLPFKFAVGMIRMYL